MKLNKVVTVTAALVLLLLRMIAVYDAGLGRVCPATVPQDVLVRFPAPDVVSLTSRSFEFGECRDGTQAVLYHGHDTGYKVPCGDVITDALRPVNCFLRSATSSAFRRVALQVVSGLLAIILLGLKLPGFLKRLGLLALALVPFDQDLTTSPIVLVSMVAIYVVGDILVAWVSSRQVATNRREGPPSRTASVAGK